MATAPRSRLAPGASVAPIPPLVHEDIDGLLANYTEDAVVRANYMAPLRGHAGLRGFLTQLVAVLDIPSLSYHTEGLAIYGDSAWHIVTYQMTSQLAGQPQQSDHGSAIALWVRDASGAWRIQHDIVNSSVPLPVSLCEKTVLSTPKLLICNAATAAEMAFSHRLALELSGRGGSGSSVVPGAIVLSAAAVTAAAGSSTRSRWA